MALFCCVSDTHTFESKLTVPPCDFLVHAGDITFDGDLHALTSFMDWMWRLPAKHKIFIAGNHDSSVQTDPAVRKWLRCRTFQDQGIWYLEEESVVLRDSEGTFWNFHGTPVTRLWGHTCAFMQPEAELSKFFGRIPECDVLLTHQPPLGILDDGLGSAELYEAVYGQPYGSRKLPYLHVFGHIHGGYGITDNPVQQSTTCVNASLLKDWRAELRDPIMVEVNKE